MTGPIENSRDWRLIISKRECTEAMKDESPTLNRITADCVQAQNRYLPDPADIDPRDFGRRVVMYRLQSAEIDVVSR
jgi:hypothetical protein